MHGQLVTDQRRRADNSDASSPKELKRYWSDPKILAAYIQLFVNTVIISGLLYLCVRFLRLVRRDVEWKVENKAVLVAKAAHQCRANYEANRCEPEERAPALEAQCVEWAHCMSKSHELRDLQHSTVLWAETLAEIINGFFKPISVKSLIILSTFTFGVIIVSNVAFGSYRVHYYGTPNRAQDVDVTSKGLRPF
ncbi:LAQU0S14e03136g1_1 [Lachancea quebecensis]|uniref:LAQU0S14e03136g1_1 n=1 Tax=Lachancea quebecensis TaxID=1654605 RepID=A0A0P1KVE0_9SACH|nr:LAQU0S14e03136g1_1 [Lachancea quebecensis]